MTARVLLALNEDPEGCKTDVRDALDALVLEGRVEQYGVYAFSQRLTDGASDGQIWHELVEMAAGLEPTLVLFFHTHTLSASARGMHALRALPSRPSIGYCEGDAYQRWYKPIPREAAALAGSCDSLFLPGALAVVPQYRRAGASDIRYVPNTADDEVQLPAPEAPDREFDVVMIANRVHSRVPLRTMPGARRRMQLARALTGEYGSRFGLFGHDWDLASSQGLVPQEEAPAILRRGRLTVGNSHLWAPHYFSNRLPVAVASGVAQVHEDFVGAQTQFRDAKALRWFSDVPEALSRIRGLLALPQDELDAAAREDRDRYADAYSTRAAIRYMVEHLQTLHDGAPCPANPWIADGRF